jgi:hypothetical protein
MKQVAACPSRLRWETAGRAFCQAGRNGTWLDKITSWPGRPVSAQWPEPR